MALIDDTALPVECEFCGATCILEKITMPASWETFPCYECPTFCPFFIRADLVRPCKCRVGICLIRTSKQDQSKGRQFWCCPKSTGPKDRGCGMFEWLEDENVRMRKKAIGDADQQAVASSSNTHSTCAKYREGYMDGAIQASETMTKLLKDLKESLMKVELDN